MFSPKKSKISKKDLKQSIVKTNDRLKSINDRMEADIKAKKSELESLSSECISAKEALEDVKGLQAYANNELEAQQFEISQIQNDVTKGLAEVERLSAEATVLEEGNKKLEDKKDKIFKFVASLEAKKEELKHVGSELKAIKKEEAEGQETLSLLAEELNELETGVESYLSRKSAAESDFRAFKAKIERDKTAVYDECANIKDRMAQATLESGKEMGKLDHAIADRMTELDDMDLAIRRKAYELSTIQSRIGSVEERVNDAEERIDIAIKKEQDKVNKIKGDFKDWKVEALDGVARMKIKGKMDNIDKAGLKEVLDG
tara:strand:- start:254 stop:1204 length:951 start_codon:yes stop_codon:yes gene_type:complete